LIDAARDTFRTVVAIPYGARILPAPLESQRILVPPQAFRRQLPQHFREAPAPFIARSPPIIDLVWQYTDRRLPTGIHIPVGGCVPALHGCGRLRATVSVRVAPLNTNCTLESSVFTRFLRGRLARRELVHDGGILQLQNPQISARW